MFMRQPLSHFALIGWDALNRVMTRDIYLTRIESFVSSRWLPYEVVTCNVIDWTDAAVELYQVNKPELGSTYTRKDYQFRVRYTTQQVNEWRRNFWAEVSGRTYSHFQPRKQHYIQTWNCKTFQTRLTATIRQQNSNKPSRTPWWVKLQYDFSNFDLPRLNVHFKK